MGVFDKLVIFFSCIVEIYMLYDYLSAFFTLRLSGRNVRYISAATVVLLFLINDQNSSIMNLILVPLLLWIYVSLVYDARVGIRLGYFVTAFTVMIGVEFLFLIITQITIEYGGRYGLVPPANYLWQLLLIKFINYIVFLIMRQTSSRSKRRITNRLFWTYLLVPATTVGTMLAVFYCGVDFEQHAAMQYILTVLFVCMIVGNMAFFYAFVQYTENLEYTQEQRVQITSQRAEIAHLHKVTQLNDNFNEITHNMRHYLKVISELAYEGDTEQIRQLVEALNGEIDRKLIKEYSSDKLLNVLLEEYVSQAEHAGIAIDVYVEPGSVLDQVQDVDLIAMVGNMLDNAVTAASKKKNARITVRIFMQDQRQCIVKVVNDMDGRLHLLDGRLQSTKHEEGVHGIGIRSIEKTAEKYGGLYQYYVENEQFCAELMLPSMK